MIFATHSSTRTSLGGRHGNNTIIQELKFLSWSGATRVGVFPPANPFVKWGWKRRQAGGKEP